MKENNNVEKINKGNKGLNKGFEELNGNLDFKKEEKESEVKIKCGKKKEESKKRDIIKVENEENGGDYFEMEEI